MPFLPVELRVSPVWRENFPDLHLNQKFYNNESKKKNIGCFECTGFVWPIVWDLCLE